ncbi:ileal sodium/bile acid cotransporter-like, partial [Saccoglossus kowalevskii]|uniref:Ileal sodium/bile acid cotransporter-like n=1 Tax=Saccoglossus kowalevskii TaxID=10224 RepID=A0ABM0N0N0_SACKO
FAFVLSVAFSLSLESALGLMLMGSCPGGGLSNIFSVLLDGDLSLSITMTFISSVLALGMMSLNLFIYSHYWVAGGHSFPVPYIQIMVSLALLCIPVAIGMITRSRKPEWAKKGVALIRPIGLLLILLALTTGVYSNLYLADQWTLTIVLASVLLPILGFILGATLARVFRRDFQKTVTISLETGIQNSALATGLIKMVYEQPDSDLLAVVPLTSAMGQFFLGIMAYVVYLLSKVTKRRNAEQKDKEQVTVITDEYTDSFQMSDGEDTSPKHISPPLSPDITYVI